MPSNRLARSIGSLIGTSVFSRASSVFAAAVSELPAVGSGLAGALEVAGAVGSNGSEGLAGVDDPDTSVGNVIAGGECASVGALP